MIRLLLFVFRNSPKTLGKHIVVYQSELTMLRCSSRTVATWLVLQMKQVTICFEVIFFTNNFRWIWFGFKHRRTVALFRTPMHRSMIRHLWRLYKRPLRHRHRIFQYFFTPIFERLPNYAGSKENKSFLRPGVHAIFNVCWWNKCRRMPLFHGRSCIISSCTASMFSGTTTLHWPRLSATVVQNQFITEL